jgi:hypothetical protein
VFEHVSPGSVPRGSAAGARALGSVAERKPTLPPADTPGASSRAGRQLTRSDLRWPLERQSRRLTAPAKDSCFEIVRYSDGGILALLARTVSKSISGVAGPGAAGRGA